MKKLGEIYSELATTITEVEKCERDELRNIAPRLGDLYTNLKNSSFHLSNTYEQHLNIIVKYIGRDLQVVSDVSRKLSKVSQNNTKEIETRSNMIKRLLYSTQKSRAGDQHSGAAELAIVREGRLRDINLVLMDNIVHSYNIEQEATLATCVNLSAHIMESQRKDKVFWEDMLKFTNSQATAV